MNKCELQAIVLAAGKGSRMRELTSLTPKCLLPIVNKPMIYYPLLSLIKAYFHDVIVVVSKNQEDEIKEAINNLLDIKLEFFSIPSNEDYGTADTLRALDINNKIKTDFIVLSCDFITDLPLIKLINYYRIYDPSLTSLISTVTITSEGVTPGHKRKMNLEKDLIGIDHTKGDRLTFLSSEADFEEELPLSLSILKKCPRFEVDTNYFDCHAYIFKQWILKYLQEKKQIKSIKGELIPKLVKKQFRSYKPSSDNSKFIFYFVEKDNITKALERLELYPQLNEKTDFGKHCQVHHDNPIKCCAFVSSDYVCVRTNQIATYFEANKQLKKIYPGMEFPLTVDVVNKKLIGSECVIGSSTSVKEKTSIKRSIIGNNCTIGEKVKITNCLIMDGVTIHDNCSIQGSILCKGVEIQKSADIKECIIADGQIVVGSTKLNNEVIRDVEHLLQL